MDIAIVNAEKRESAGSLHSRRLRRAGRVPAVLYGHKQDTVLISLDEKEARALMESGAHVATVRLGDNQEQALIKEVQFDALGDEILHLDLARVALDETVEVHVEIVLHGEPKGVGEGGILDQPLKTLNMTCPVVSIPDRLIVEVSHLEIGDHLNVAALPLAESMKALVAPGTIVAMVRAPAIEEAEEVPVEEEAPAEPERIGEEEKRDKPEEAEEGS